MSDLQNNDLFIFVSQIMHWDSAYAEHVASTYSSYSNEDTAMLALCKDYGLDYSSILERNYIPDKQEYDVTEGFINEQVCNSIMSLVRNSRSSDLMYYTRHCLEASRYFMKPVTATKFDLCYKDYRRESETVIGRLELTLDCISSTDKPNIIRKRDDRYYGHVVNVEDDVVIKFVLRLKHSRKK